VYIFVLTGGLPLSLPGLLITFIELIKNPTYNFWKHEFVHCAPEIQKLFESVARSCMVPSVPRMDMDGQLVD
jgi:CCR4-NOT transcription complex subunit 1